MFCPLYVTFKIGTAVKSYTYIIIMWVSFRIMTVIVSLKFYSNIQCCAFTCNHIYGIGIPQVYMFLECAFIKMKCDPNVLFFLNGRLLYYSNQDFLLEVCLEYINRIFMKMFLLKYNSKKFLLVQAYKICFTFNIKYLLSCFTILLFDPTEFYIKNVPCQILHL